MEAKGTQLYLLLFFLSLSLSLSVSISLSLSRSLSLSLSPSLALSLALPLSFSLSLSLSLYLARSISMSLSLSVSLTLLLFHIISLSLNMCMCAYTELEDATTHPHKGLFTRFATPPAKPRSRTTLGGFNNCQYDGPISIAKVSIVLKQHDMAVSMTWRVLPLCNCPTMRALLCGVYIRNPDFWKLPYWYLSAYMKPFGDVSDLQALPKVDPMVF